VEGQEAAAFATRSFVSFAHPCVRRSHCDPPTASHNMFLAHISERRLLPPQPETTDVLSHFTMATARRMCELTLRDVDRAASTRNAPEPALRRPFDSSTHCYWVMEVIGRGMGLPVVEDSHLDVMEQGINIYERWLGAYRGECVSLRLPACCCVARVGS